MDSTPKRLGVESYRPGTKVVTPAGSGTVLYVRMRPPDFSVPMSVSVRLDARAHECCYQGSLFVAADVVLV